LLLIGLPDGYAKGKFGFGEMPVADGEEVAKGKRGLSSLQKASRLSSGPMPGDVVEILFILPTWPDSFA